MNEPTLIYLLTFQTGVMVGWMGRDVAAVFQQALERHRNRGRAA